MYFGSIAGRLFVLGVSREKFRPFRFLENFLGKEGLLEREGLRLQKPITETWKLTNGEWALYTENPETAELARQARLRSFGVYLQLAGGKKYAAQFRGAKEIIRAVAGQKRRG